MKRILSSVVALLLVLSCSENGADNDPTGPGGGGSTVRVPVENTYLEVNDSYVDSTTGKFFVTGSVKNLDTENAISAPFYVGVVLLLETITGRMDTLGFSETAIPASVAPRGEAGWTLQIEAAPRYVLSAFPEDDLVPSPSVYHKR